MTSVAITVIVADWMLSVGMHPATRTIHILPMQLAIHMLIKRNLYQLFSLLSYLVHVQTFNHICVDFSCQELVNYLQNQYDW